jgi:hypothetical protein
MRDTMVASAIADSFSLVMPDDNSAILIIPDMHHKVEVVERIRRNHPGLPAVFLGDYFDDFYDTAADMETTCRWLKNAIRGEKDTFLLGNHCFAYLAYEIGTRWGACSGWDLAKQQVFHRHFPGDALLKSARWIMYCQGWLISHAGISRKLYQSFARRKTAAEILEWVHDAESALTVGVTHPAFLAGIERGGPAQVGGILWCDWDTFEPIKGIRQIVGHTPGTEVRYKRDNVCIDTHLHHYGLLENGELKILEPE